MRRALLAALLALAALPAAAGAVAPPAFDDGPDLHVESVEQVGPRLFELTLTTPLLTAPTRVRILLPEDYDAHPRRRYPVLWLFHGTSGGARDWTSEPGRAQDITAGLPLITVMPDAGVDSDGGGWFTNWVNGGRYGPPEWETWHVERLIPWIDSSLRTIPKRGGRAIAGLSQGGFGALSYAARHPQLFAAAASFSGALDIAANPLRADPLVTPVINATEVFLTGVPANTFFGDRVTNEVNWRAHDPATLAGNLRGMRLYAWTGDGRPGPLDGADYNPASAGIEAGVHELSGLFHGELVERSIPIDYRDYGAGTHSWAYWERDLRELMEPLMADFAEPPPRPAAVDYTSDAARWSQWGWTVEIERPAREFSRLSRAGRRGFTLTGSGTATVLTPRFYRPRARMRVVISSSEAGPVVRRRLRARRSGRLRIELPLGPGNPRQQFTAGAQTRSYATSVRIARVRRAGKRVSASRARAGARPSPGARSRSSAPARRPRAARRAR